MFGLPTPFAVCTVMWLFHGLVLDILIIGVLPFLSASASDAQRAEKFPWANGGYDGFPKVPNLDPTHRRFIAENAVYALLRASPAIFITNVPVITLCVISYLLEGMTICWEITCHKAPPSSMLPQIGLAVFATVSTYAVATNPDDFIADVPAELLLVMKCSTAATWLCWVLSASSIAIKPKKA